MLNQVQMHMFSVGEAKQSLAQWLLRYWEENGYPVIGGPQSYQENALYNASTAIDEALEAKSITLQQKLMNDLRGTETLTAFEASNREDFRRFQSLALNDDEGQDKFFTELLGDNLARRIIKSNDIQYGSKINLRNHYIAYARQTFGDEFVKAGTSWDRER